MEMVEEEKETFSHMEVVWRFVSGLTGFKAIGWDVVQTRRGKDGLRWVTPFLVQCLYEAQEECESVLGRSKVTFGGFSTGFDCFAVGYCIAVSKCWELMFGCGGLGAEMVEMLVCGMKSKEEVLGSIEELILFGNPIKQEGVAHLKEMPNKILRNISRLDLQACELDGAALELYTLRHHSHHDQSETPQHQSQPSRTWWNSKTPPGIRTSPQRTYPGDAQYQHRL